MSEKMVMERRAEAHATSTYWNIGTSGVTVGSGVEPTAVVLLAAMRCAIQSRSPTTTSYAKQAYKHAKNN